MNSVWGDIIHSDTVLQEKVGTIYDHPTTQYEQFIEQYYGRHKGSGKSKAMVISDGQVICLISECDVMGEGGGGFQLNVTMTLFWKKKFGDAPLVGKKLRRKSAW